MAARTQDLGRGLDVIRVRAMNYDPAYFCRKIVDASCINAGGVDGMQPYHVGISVHSFEKLAADGWESPVS